MWNEFSFPIIGPVQVVILVFLHAISVQLGQNRTPVSDTVFNSRMIVNGKCKRLLKKTPVIHCEVIPYSLAVKSVKKYGNLQLRYSCPPT
jgi:hypothetical protein